MNEWFLDASALLAALDEDDSEHAGALELMHGGGLHTLDLAFYEVTNVAACKWRRPDRADEARRALGVIDRTSGLLRVDVELMAAAARLSAQHEITAYDASYVAGARRKGVQLVSCDLKDLVGNGLAVTPTQAVAAARAASDDR